MSAVSLENVSKIYSPRRSGWGKLTGRAPGAGFQALDNVSLNIEHGEFFGLLGPNGAGKTTLVKLCCGLIRPTSGEVSVLGHEPSRRRAAFLQSIAVVFGQKSMLWWDVPTIDSMLVHRAMYSLDGPTYRRRVAELTEGRGLLERGVARVCELGDVAVLRDGAGEEELAPGDELVLMAARVEEGHAHPRAPVGDRGLEHAAAAGLHRAGLRVLDPGHRDEEVPRAGAAEVGGGGAVAPGPEVEQLPDGLDLPVLGELAGCLAAEQPLEPGLLGRHYSAPRRSR